MNICGVEFIKVENKKELPSKKLALMLWRHINNDMYAVADTNNPITSTFIKSPMVANQNPIAKYIKLHPSEVEVYMAIGGDAVIKYFEIVNYLHQEQKLIYQFTVDKMNKLHKDILNHPDVQSHYGHCYLKKRTKSIAK